MNSYKNNDLDNYEAEIVEDIPEQFDLSRYRKQKPLNYRLASSTTASATPYNAPAPFNPSLPFNGSNVTTLKPPNVATQRYKSSNESQDIRFPFNNLDPYGGAFQYDASGRIDPLDSNILSLQAKNPLYTRTFPTLQPILPANLGQQNLPGYATTKSSIHHRLPHISATPLSATSNQIQVPIPQYATSQQPTQTHAQSYHPGHQSSGMESYGSLATNTLPSHQSNSVSFNTDFQKKYTTNKIADSATKAEIIAEPDDDQRYSYDTVRRKYKSEDKSKSPSHHGSVERTERNKLEHSSSEYYVKDNTHSSYARKVNYDTSPDSDGSAYSDDGEKHSSGKIDTSYRLSNNNSESTITLKSNLKQTKKHGVKFDEKLEVYEVNNPHYGVEAKSEKREMKKKKKDKKKEDEILLKAKLDIKAKIQAQKSILYNYYENTLLFNALNYYEENYYRAFILKFQDKIRTNKLDDKLRDQFLQQIERDNYTTIEIINSIKNIYSNKLQQFCLQYQCQPENLHTYPGMMQTMHNIANSINYIEIINNYINKESDSGSTLSKILGHDSKSDKLQANSMAVIKPPIKRKADILPPKIVMAAIDLHVRDVTMDRFKTLTELVFKLKEICEIDLHIVRALFKYVLMTQLETLRNSETGSYLMRNYDTGLESANTIFSRLCSFAGIENRCIRGLWKNITCEPGEKTDLKCLWNIVNLSTGWRFIQPAFTPVRFFSKPETKFEETEFYFLSDPDNLYYEFLPLDKLWIFGDTSLTVKDFEKRPIITPYFRTLNLSIITQESNLISNLEKEPFKVTIQYPHNVADIINFKYKLKQITNSKNALNALSEQNGESNFNQYVISEIISNEDAVVFKIPALPDVGHYSFIIYTEKDEITASQTSYPPSMSVDNCKAIAAFRLSCSKLIHFETPPNHIQEINIFGMNNIMKKLGLVCCDYNKGVLGTDREGKVNLVFEMLQPLDLEVYLYSSDVSISSKFLELCILKRVVHNFLIVIIYPPHPGLYGLDLHGAPKGTFNSLLHSQLPPIGKYLIKSHHQVRSFTQFPKGDNRDWGPKQRFYDLGLHTVGNIDPYIINEDGKQIEIEIAMLKPLTIWYKFDYDMNGTTKAIDNYCFMNYKTTNKRDKIVSFLLRFPQRGFYHLAIMATEIYPSKPDEIVYNYLIRVQDPSNDVQKFPIIVNPILWRECSLITPKNYVLNSYDTHFSVIVPNATCVQVTTDEGVTENLEAKEIENSWVGLVSLYNAKFVHVEIEFEGKIHRLIRFKGPNPN